MKRIVVYWVDQERTSFPGNPYLRVAKKMSGEHGLAYSSMYSVPEIVHFLVKGNFHL